MGNFLAGDPDRLTSSSAAQTTDASMTLIASDERQLDPVAIDQLRQTARLEGITRVVGLPDLHAGRGIAVGAAFWSPTHIHPHLVGSDIGCGMGLWETTLKLRKFRVDAAERKLHGLDGPWDGDHAAACARAGLPDGTPDPALGTIGGGNHFAELQRIERVVDPDRFEAMWHSTDRLWFMVHSGSRGLGHAILERQLALRGTAGIEAARADGTAYLAEHDRAVRWAVLNREIIAQRTAADWMQRLEGKDVCINIVASLEQAMSDPQFRDRGLFSRSVIGGDHDALPAVSVPVCEPLRDPRTELRYPRLGEANGLLAKPRDP